MTKLNRPIALVILDGWGIGRADDAYNAIARANTPNIDALQAAYPSARLRCSGEAVGLPDGQMGNSEVGHMNIGAGRVVYQELTRITKAIREQSFFSNKALCALMEAVKQRHTALHLLGLLSDGGVHSHNTHLYALLKMAAEYGIEKVYVHAFMDGRDVPPSSGKGYIVQLQEKIDELGCGRIATVAGRYYAMDRDKHWERTAKAYEAMTMGRGRTADSGTAAIEQAYAEKITDEFVVPTVIGDYQGMNSGDGAVFFNFRPDRARQLTRAFTDLAFDGFPRQEGLKVDFVTMTQYEKGLNVQVAYEPQTLANTLGEVLSAAKMKQLRIAETEKYAHVTFFFNGGVEAPNEGEERILIPSPQVATFDLKPSMSCAEVTDRLTAEIAAERYDIIIANYANGDMVGHTGVFEAAVTAVESVDVCIGRVVKAVQAVGGVVCITADHGNAEIMKDAQTGEPFTAHTTNEVPFMVIDDKIKTVKDGALCDIAPTLLTLAGLNIPPEMTGHSLL